MKPLSCVGHISFPCNLQKIAQYAKFHILVSCVLEFEISIAHNSYLRKE